MANKLAAVILFLASSTGAFAQSTDTEKTAARPDLPGVFTLEVGVNRPLSGPDNMDIGLWGSRTINIYYQYEFRIMKSKMSFIPGIGLSLERFKFTNGAVVNYTDNTRDTITMIPIGEQQFRGIRKSQLITNYVEVPLELRYTSNPDDPARSLKFSVGARVGYMYDAFTKVKYRDDGETRQFKDKQNFNLNRFRYGVFTKIGVGNFGLFGYYNLSTMFKEGEGFYDNNRKAIDFNTFTVGLTLSSF